MAERHLDGAVDRRARCWLPRAAWLQAIGRPIRRRRVYRVVLAAVP